MRMVEEDFMEHLLEVFLQGILILLDQKKGGLQQVFSLRGLIDLSSKVKD